MEDVEELKTTIVIDKASDQRIRSGHCPHVMKLMEKGVTATTEKAMGDTKILLATWLENRMFWENATVIF